MSSAVRPKPAATRSPMVSPEALAAASRSASVRHPQTRDGGLQVVQCHLERRLLPWRPGLEHGGAADALRRRAWFEAVDAVVHTLFQLAWTGECERVVVTGGQAVDADSLPRQFIALHRRRRRQRRHGEGRDDEREEGVQAEGQDAGDHDHEGDSQDQQWTQEAVSVDFRRAICQPRPMPDSRDSLPAGVPGPPPRRSAADLRSQRWFAPDDLRSFGHRSRLKQMGYSAEDAEGKPVIAILNTWSDLQQCHTHFRERAEDVKQGVWQAGGFPVEMPVLSLSEMFMKPTAMFYRNLLAMEVEEILRSHPIDGAVLMGGCDKTMPGLLMGAISIESAGDLRARGPDAGGALPAPSVSAAAPTSGNTGPNARPATSTSARCGRSRTASPDRPAPA